MIRGSETNKVYLSSIIQSDSRYSSACSRLIEIFQKHNVKYGFLDSTKDIWCRDYMPIQIRQGQFVQFRFEPTYLEGFRDLQSDTEEVCTVNRIAATHSKINLDGGNVVNWSDRAIVTDRIYQENPEYTDRFKLISELEEKLEVEVIVIPQIKTDMTGHADGLVRWVNQNTVVGNDREAEFKYWKNGINKVLKAHDLEYIDFPFFEFNDKNHPESAIGCYLNYLEISDLIIMPIFEVPGNKDSQALDLLQKLFPDRIIETINYNEIGVHGGLLNCTTWTVKE